MDYASAKLLGLKRYYTGEPCKFGHISERLVSNKGCLVCSKIRLKKWQLLNPDKVRRLDLERHKRDREKRNKAKRDMAKLNVKRYSEIKNKWAAANRAKVLAIQKRWNEKNRHKINAYAANRRCLLRGSGKHTGNDVKEIYLKQNGICLVCKSVLVKWHVDHIIPISKGGSNTKDNLQLLCKTCNLRKGAKYMEDFLKIASRL